jgi:hypothetical protein
MICQHSELVQRGRSPVRANNLLMVPYFTSLGGDDSMMLELTSELNSKCDEYVGYFGRNLSLATVDAHHAAWLEKQANRLEDAVHGRCRPEVAAYFTSLRSVVDGHKVVRERREQASLAGEPSSG